jgi:hypothetical protein
MYSCFNKRSILTAVEMVISEGSKQLVVASDCFETSIAVSKSSILSVVGMLISKQPVVTH